MKVFELIKTAKTTNTNQQPNPYKNVVGFGFVGVSSVLLSVSIDIILIYNIIIIFVNIIVINEFMRLCGLRAT
ncbi:MAG: hypothetical protein QXL29_08295 [Zestosphaera sp.]|uniref:hypothetical protein n=1 Tax=Desulfurococcus sp. TaxID=51678 RepID=UPI003162E81C